MSADLMELKDQIKNSVTMIDVIDRLNLGPIRGGKIKSIYKPEKTPSLHIYKYDFFDYATGQGGDVIRFTMDAMGWSFATAVRWLARGGDELAPRRKEPERKIQDLTKMFSIGSDGPEGLPWTVAEEYVKNKWPTLSIHDIIGYGSRLKSTGSLWTPHWHDGKVVGIKIRDLRNGSKRSVTGSTFRMHLYKAEHYVGLARRAWLVEGESDCWALTKHFATRSADPVDVYALPSGAGLWRDEWRKELEEYDLVTVAMDPDAAGSAALERICGSLKGHVPLAVASPAPYKDIAEALAHGREPVLWAVHV